MESAIEVIWGIGLVGALILTLVILKEVALVLRALHDILRLAGFTAEAAGDLRRHLGAVAGLEGLAAPATDVRQAVETVAAHAASLQKALGHLADPSTAGRS